MVRPFPTLLLLALVSSGLVLSPAWGQDGKSKTSVSHPKEVTVTKLGEKGMAHVKAQDGAEYEVHQGTGWKVGDTLLCEEDHENTKVTLEHCRKH